MNQMNQTIKTQPVSPNLVTNQQINEINSSNRTFIIFTIIVAIVGISMIIVFNLLYDGSNLLIRIGFSLAITFTCVIICLLVYLYNLGTFLQ